MLQFQPLLLLPLAVSGDELLVAPCAAHPAQDPGSLAAPCSFASCREALLFLFPDVVSLFMYIEKYMEENTLLLNSYLLLTTFR